MDQARQISTITPTRPDPHLQRIDRQRRVQPRGHLPAHDPTREHIQDERDIHPSGERPHIRNVRDPQLVDRLGREVTIDEIRRSTRLRCRFRRPGPLRSANAAESRLSHQPLDGAPGHLVALPAQLGMNLPRPVDAVVLLMHLCDLLRQLLVPLLPG